MATRGKSSGAAAVEVALAVALVMAVAAVTGSAQQVPTCASKLVPCASYLNSTSPPESCCGPLKQAAKDERDCLCSLFNDKTVLQAFKVNIEEALQLAKRCGVDTDKSICSKSNTTTTAAAPSASDSSRASPVAQNVNAAAHGMTLFGMLGIASLLLFWWSVMA